MLCGGCISQVPLRSWSDRDVKQPVVTYLLRMLQHPKRKKGRKKGIKDRISSTLGELSVRRALTWGKHLSSSCPMSLWSCATPPASRNDFSAWAAAKVWSSSASRPSTVHSCSASSQSSPPYSASMWLHFTPGGDKKIHVQPPDLNLRLLT